MSEHPVSGGPVAAARIADLAAASRILAERGVVDGFGPFRCGTRTRRTVT